MSTPTPPEFTGERVIPGLVERDLWNEHISRYAFASRLARRKRVLDLGCGTGYGSSLLAASAASTVGIDLAPDAVTYARQRYQAPNLRFLAASCAALPFRNASFDLLVAFEVIEHIPEWRNLIQEARRLLSPGGQFIVSTPNIHYYTETRRQSGPNRFHHHEFEFDEYSAELRQVFPEVALFFQNHAEALVFQPLEATGATDLKLEPVPPNAADAHFFIAVCASARQTGAPTFVYLPSTANVLREREQHIDKLQSELEQKDAWLAQAHQEHSELVAEHRAQTHDLEQSNLWARKLGADLQASAARVLALQEELAAEQAAAAATVAGYESKVAELERDNEAKTHWAIETERRLSSELAAKCDELARCVDILHQVEAERDERSAWAAQLQQQLERAEQHLRTELERLEMVRASRWLRLGRLMHVGPDLAQGTQRS